MGHVAQSVVCVCVCVCVCARARACVGVYDMFVVLVRWLTLAFRKHVCCMHVRMHSCDVCMRMHSSIDVCTYSSIDYMYVHTSIPECIRICKHHMNAYSCMYVHTSILECIRICKHHMNAYSRMYTRVCQGHWWCWRCCGLGCLSPWFSSGRFWATKRTPSPCLCKPIPFPDRSPPSCGSSLSCLHTRTLLPLY